MQEIQEMRVQSLCGGRYPSVETGNLLQYSCLGNSMDREAWQATVHGITKIWAQLSTHEMRWKGNFARPRDQGLFCAPLSLQAQTHLFTKRLFFCLHVNYHHPLWSPPQPVHQHPLLLLAEGGIQGEGLVQFGELLSFPWSLPRIELDMRESHRVRHTRVMQSQTWLSSLHFHFHVYMLWWR